MDWRAIKTLFWEMELPKLRSGSDLKVGVDFSVTLKADSAPNVVAKLQQILQELELSASVRIE